MQRIMTKGSLASFAALFVCPAFAQMPNLFPEDKQYSAQVLQLTGQVSVLKNREPWVLNVGDWVLGYLGWQKYGKCHGDLLTKLDPSVPVTTALGVLGMPGRTAWFGLMEAGKPRYTCALSYHPSYILLTGQARS